MVFALAPYATVWRQALVRYKYRAEKGRAADFGHAVADYLDRHSTWFEEFDLLVPVPAYTGPGSIRGWDPVGLIVSELRLRLGVGWDVAPRAVVKRRETPRMQGRTWWQRQRVATGPLRAALWVPDPGVVAGARVLLFDDVLTEGGTLREVARALRLAGAAEVAGLVLARPVWVE